MEHKMISIADQIFDELEKEILSGVYERGEVLRPEANTNLMSPRTVIPTLHASLPAGTTTLVCAVWCDAGDLIPNEIPEEVLNIAQQS